MSPPRKRARRTEPLIYSLPDEVMELIFDRLYVCDIISASLTCHRWNNILFESTYISRFALRVMAMNYQVVAKSQRCYRNVNWVIREQRILSIWKKVYPKITNNLYSLNISMLKIKKATIASVVTLVAEALPQMTQLRSFVLIDCFDQDTFDLDITPTFRSNSVRSLTIACNIKARVDMPELRSFEGNLYALNTPDECTQPHALDNLKVLIIRFNDLDEPLRLSTAATKSIIRRLTNIEKMVFETLVEDEIFDAICENCTTLKEFAFDGGISYSNMLSLPNLTKLTNLRSVRISSLYRLQPGQKNSALDWSNLSQIEHLHLGADVEEALKLPKSLEKLEVVISNDSEENMIKTITSGAAHLKELKVVFSDCRSTMVYDYDQPLNLLRALSSLKQLEVLIFHGRRFSASS
ncbi:uncharacterized protein LOC118463594 [Anopheles albimanus]|uniref:uncharacterized protein LOC118463594 n=1 Tax=Anopheles albimanus TaxID=7167 RepID=UPI00163EA69B|nr:uncharacterized protein LOC118463594 [Anopheles albimanus]